MRHLLYLHGFASSPRSSKARYLAGRLAEHGVALDCPDLNEPDFATLTTTRMLQQVAARLRRLPAAPVVLIGSSLGAFAALHFAERAAQEVPAHPVEKLVLLAPAFDFGRAGMPSLGAAGLARWRRDGWLEMQHHAYGEPRRVHYALYDDAGRYDSFAVRTTVPALVCHGRRDEVVDPAMVRRFAAGRPHVRLVMLDDDHQLGGSLERLWTETAAFLGLGGPA